MAVKRPFGTLWLAIAVLAMAMAAGPTLLALAEAAVPLVAAIAAAICVVKIVAFHTRRE